MLAGQALARAALASAGRPQLRPGLRPGLALAADHVAERVALLLAPPPVRKPWPLLFGLGAGIISWVATIAVADWADHVVQLAERVYQRH